MSSVCLSVCLSVTLVDCDHTGWNSSKIISRLVSVCRSLSAPKHRGSIPRGATWNLGPKWPTPLLVWESNTFDRKAAEWLDIAQRSQCRAYRKLPLLFRVVPLLTPYGLPFPENGGSICPKIREWPYLCNGWTDTLHVWFSGRVFRVGGSNGAISGYIKSKLVAGSHLG